MLTVALGLTPIAPQASRKAWSLFVCEFVHYLPARRKNAISIRSAYFAHFRANNSFMEVLAPTLGALACESTVEHYGFHDRDHFDHSRFYYEDPYDGKGNSLPGGP